MTRVTNRIPNFETMIGPFDDGYHKEDSDNMEGGVLKDTMMEESSSHDDLISDISRRTEAEEAEYLATNLATYEHKRVIQTKWIVISVLSVGAVVLGGAIYSSLQADERMAFETQVSYAGVLD